MDLTCVTLWFKITVTYNCFLKVGSSCWTRLDCLLKVGNICWTGLPLTGREYLLV